MWDSSAQSVRGALWGELVQLGNFDECLALEEAHHDADLGEGALEPGYCLAKIDIASQDDFGLTDQFKGSAWQKIKVTNLGNPHDAPAMRGCLPLTIVS